MSISITRQQSRQQPSSLCALPEDPHGGTNTCTLFLTHLLLHTYCSYCCEGNRWKNQRGEKKGKAPQEYNKCCWTWPVSNQHSSDRCNMFTKQTSSTDVREMKMGTSACMTCEKKPGIQAGISLRALKVFQRDEKTACHTRTARVSCRICLMLLAPGIPGSSGC